MIECVAVLSAEVLIEALPELSDAVPSEVAPSKNSTVPVAVPEPGAFVATETVMVTD